MLYLTFPSVHTAQGFRSSAYFTLSRPGFCHSNHFRLWDTLFESRRMSDIQLRFQHRHLSNRRRIHSSGRSHHRWNNRYLYRNVGVDLCKCLVHMFWNGSKCLNHRPTTCVMSHAHCTGLMMTTWKPFWTETHPGTFSPSLRILIEQPILACGTAMRDFVSENRHCLLQACSLQ